MRTRRCEDAGYELSPGVLRKSDEEDKFSSYIEILKAVEPKDEVMACMRWTYFESVVEK